MNPLTRDEQLELADHGSQVLMLQTCFSNTVTHARLIPDLVLDLAGDGSWRRFTSNRARGVVFEYGPAEFRKFLEAPIPGGCGAKIELVERMLRGTPAWEVFLELTRGEPGGLNNPDGSNQHTSKGKEVNCDDVTVDLPEPNKPPATGNSVSYALRRLSRERPDLYERVKAGELTANAAMVAAGFRDRTVQVPADPERAARALARLFDPAALAELVRLLESHLGRAA